MCSPTSQKILQLRAKPTCAETLPIRNLHFFNPRTSLPSTPGFSFGLFIHSSLSFLQPRELFILSYQI